VSYKNAISKSNTNLLKLQRDDDSIISLVPKSSKNIHHILSNQFYSPKNSILLSESPSHKYGLPHNKVLENSNFSTFASKEFLARRKDKCERNKNVLSLKPIDPSLVKQQKSLSPSNSSTNYPLLKISKDLPMND
jgi:hypothetical protein